MIILSIILSRFIDKKTTKLEGEKIENGINHKASYETILRMINSAKQKEKFRAAVIFSFYYYRIFCQEELGIKNSRVLSPEEIQVQTRGITKISQKDVTKLNEIYRKARFTKEDITFDDVTRSKFLLEKIIE